jgi:hypothetical protein
VRRAALAAAVLPLALAACGGGPGSADGTVGGHSLKVLQAVFFAAKEPTVALVVLSSRTDACDAAARQELLAGETSLRFTLEAYSGGASTWLDTTDYKVATSGDRIVTNVLFTARDAACGGGPAYGSGGTVSLGSLDPQTEAKGSFDLMFDAQELKGDFDATLCSADLPTPGSGCRP